MYVEAALFKIYLLVGHSFCTKRFLHPSELSNLIDQAEVLSAWKICKHLS